jgi:hypothetical protein
MKTLYFSIIFILWALMVFMLIYSNKIFIYNYSMIAPAGLSESPNIEKMLEAEIRESRALKAYIQGEITGVEFHRLFPARFPPDISKEAHRFVITIHFVECLKSARVSL